MMDENTNTPQLTEAEAFAIREYCAEEVRRQYWGQTPPTYADIGMERAWHDALLEQFKGSDITPDLIARWGRMIEPEKNQAGFRSVPVFVGMYAKLDWRLIDRAMYGFCNALKFGEYDAFAAYREFEEIHPFVDGNGRTGKIILNWVNGTLIDPIFPPEDFWGPRIVNP